MHAWEAGGDEQWLLCTQLRTWLDGLTALSPGTWQGACSVMSLTAHPPPALRSEEVWHVVPPSEQLRQGWGEGSTRSNAHPRSPSEALPCWPLTLGGGSRTFPLK